MKLKFPLDQLKFIKNSKKEDKETKLKVNYDKGVLLWMIGGIKKEQLFKQELLFQIRDGLQATEIKKLVLCFRFDIPGFTASKTRLLKVEARGENQQGLKKNGLELTKCGYFEVHLN